jgi:hypothetical protein
MYQFMKIKMTSIFKLSFIITICSHSAFTQIQYTQHFTNELKRCRADFIAPVEGWYKIKLLKNEPGPRYDLALQSEEKDFELRFSLQPEYRVQAPHITCLTTASTLAINDDHADIHVNVFTADQALEFFHADWAAYADFVPKPSLTQKYYGRLVTLFRQDDGLMQIVMFFNEHDEEKDRRIYSLSFLAEATENN